MSSEINNAGRSVVKEIQVPKKLYKYYSDSCLKFVFGDWTIRFTPAVEFNDPFECLPHIISLASKEHQEEIVELGIDDIIKEEAAASKKKKARRIQKMMRARSKRDEVKALVDAATVGAAKFAMNKIYEKVIRDFGVLCLSEENLNLLMWSHYANSHMGFAVGFDMESDFFTTGCSLPIWKPKKIDYVSERPSKFFSELSSDMKEILYTKGDIWGYENEWRMIAPLELPLAWVEGKTKGVHHLPRKSVSEVIFGARMSGEEVRLVCQIIKQQPDCKHIRLQWARLHDSKYELVLEDIPPSFWQKKS